MSHQALPCCKSHPCKLVEKEHKMKDMDIQRKVKEVEKKIECTTISQMFLKDLET